MRFKTKLVLAAVILASAGNAMATTGDGVATDVINSDAGGAYTVSNTGIQLNKSRRLQAFAEPGTLVPAAHTVMAGTIEVKATIAPTTTLNMTTPVVLDGLSTMEVHYL